MYILSDRNLQKLSLNSSIPFKDDLNMRDSLIVSCVMMTTTEKSLDSFNTTAQAEEEAGDAGG